MRIKFKTSECSCAVCTSMCRNPCVPTPEEADKLISLGHIDNLETYYSYGHGKAADETIEVVRPKQKPGEYEIDYHGNDLPFRFGKCVYFDEREKNCLLHNLGIKPLEGRLAIHDMNNSFTKSGIHEYVCSRWNSLLAAEILYLINKRSIRDGNFDSVPYY